MIPFLRCSLTPFVFLDSISNDGKAILAEGE